MKRMFVFAKRNMLEMLRDPLNICFGIGFPVALLLLLTLIQNSIPTEAADANIFPIDKLTPGMAVFGLSFVALFSGILISKDRSESFLMRLYNAPMRPSDFILGYIVPALPMAFCQSLVCFAVGACLGFKISINTLWSLLTLIPTALLYISIGMLCGSSLTDKQIGGVCGALLTNLSAWLSGVWFNVSDIGGAFEATANALPFIHAVNASQMAAAGNFTNILTELAWVVGFSAAFTIIAVWVFRLKMRSEKV